MSAPAESREFLPGDGIRDLVSVIVPTYNRVATIGATIDSVLASTWTNFEIVIVDDGSTDDTASLVSRYRDERIRYFRTENGGLSAARNHALDQARGEFIAFLDSDDTWSPWKLAVQVEIFRRHPEVGLVWTDMSAFDKDPSRPLRERFIRTFYSAHQHVDLTATMRRAGKLGDLTSDVPEAGRDAPYFVGDIFREMFIGNLVHPSTAIVSRERLRKGGRYEFALTGPGAEDYHFYYRIASHGLVAFVDAVTTQYRINDPTALTYATRDQARGNLNVVLHWLDRPRPPLPPEIVAQRVGSAYRWAGREELFDGDARQARKWLRKSLATHRDASTLTLFALSLMPNGTVGALRRIKRLVKRRA